MIHRQPSSYRFIFRAGLATAMLATLLALAPAVGAARPSSCELFPGDTTVRWQSVRDEVSTVEIGWFDADGQQIAQTTIVVQQGRPFHAQQTPAGAVEFGAGFFDDAGNQFAVTGGGCF